MIVNITLESSWAVRNPTYGTLRHRRALFHTRGSSVPYQLSLSSASTLPSGNARSRTCTSLLRSPDTVALLVLQRTPRCPWHSTLSRSLSPCTCTLGQLVLGHSELAPRLALHTLNCLCRFTLSRPRCWRTSQAFLVTCYARRHYTTSQPTFHRSRNIRCTTHGPLKPSSPHSHTESSKPYTN